MSGDRLKTIMLHQAGLMMKFREIESANGFDFPAWPVDPASMVGQHECRRLAWCIQEELCEAGIAYNEEDKEAIRRELMDALHFIAELLLTLGYWPSDLPPVRNPEIFRTFSDSLTQAMLNLGKAINQMKSKPWKQSLKHFDEEYFKRILADFIYDFIATCRAVGMSDEMIEERYLGVAANNQARIDTGV